MTYDLETPLTPPPLPGSVIVRRDPDDLIDVLGSELLLHARTCVRAFGDFHLALSGGSTPEPLYKRLMYDPPLREMPWKRTHLWIVDERRVPETDNRSNFKMIREYIVDHSGIPEDQVHPVPVGLDDPATAYEQTLREVLGWREKGHDRLDCCLLGMGDDAHTASLFPGSPAQSEDERLIANNSGPSVTPPDRVTMTYRLINASRLIAVMVTGQKKRTMLARVAAASERGDGNLAELPILGIRPVGGELRWYLDGDACPAPEEVASAR